MYGGANYQQWANDEIALIVMIETAEALEKLDEILAVPGIDAAYIGPSDLAYAIGIPPTGDNNDPKHVETVNRIFEACKRHGVAPGVHTASVEYTTRFLKQGFQLVMLGADLAFMRRVASGDLQTARANSGVSAVQPGA
jgi:4-hydroxy-2-oxoheptanedioate aldolase